MKVRAMKFVIFCFLFAFYPSLVLANVWKYSESSKTWIEVVRPGGPGPTYVQCFGCVGVYQLANSYNTSYKLEGGKIFSSPLTIYGNPSWQMIDNNPRAIQLAVSYDNNVYQLHNDHEIWKYYANGGWIKIDDNQRTAKIVAGTRGVIYQMHGLPSLEIFRSLGGSCYGNANDVYNASCSKWEKIDSNQHTNNIWLENGELTQDHF